MREYPKPAKGDTAAELAFVFSQQGPVLVFCTQPNWVESVCKAILGKSLLYRQLAGEQIPPHFSNVISTRSLELAKEWLGEGHIATQALSQGIAPHHGRLPNVVREAIEVDCRAGLYRVIVATNTLAQGVNLPVRTVIMHSTWRADEEGQPSRIPVRDYWNIAGRAGRAGMETEGLVIHIALTPQDERDFAYYGDLSNLEPVTGALYQLLEQIVASRIPEEAKESAADTLDPEILAIAVEEDIETAASEKWATSLNGTFAALLARGQDKDIDPLIASTRIAAANIFERAPELSWRRVYAQTGLSSLSCQTLRQFVNDHTESLRNLLKNAGLDDLKALNRLVIDCNLRLPEAQTTTAFAGDPEVLLDLWIDGQPLSELPANVLDVTDSVEQLSRYIEELFGYRLPWIVSALFRIARESLGIRDDELSEYIRSYPSMVKYGLPDPVASWAMSAGINTRSVALLLAEAFGAQTSDMPSHETFVAWLSDLSDDALRHDYHVTAHVLDDLRYKLGRVAINPLLKPIKPLHTILPVREEVVGIRYDNRRVAARRVKVGDKLELRRDYENPVDSNAVGVHHRFGQIGYLPRNLAQRIAPEIDSGVDIGAIAVQAERMGNPAIIVELGIE